MRRGTGSRRLAVVLTVWVFGAVGVASAAPPLDHVQLFGGRWFHAPVADDDCTVCHTIHRDPVGPSLQREIPELCYQCHENMAAHDVVHEPVGEGRCTDCHLVHTSDQKNLLRKPIPDLCYECHPLGDAEHVARNTLCTTCHAVHSSDTARFLKGERTRNCGKCHADIRTGERRHAPARQGKCLTCHFTHPDPRFEVEFLRQAFPRTPTAPYAEGIYGLCDGCHDPARYADAGYLDTGFRDGDENLHARHVQADLSCAACHEIHGRDEPALVGMWVRLPGRRAVEMGFRPDDGGGRCGPSCHDEAVYRRGDGR